MSIHSKGWNRRLETLIILVTQPKVARNSTSNISVNVFVSATKEIQPSSCSIRWSFGQTANGKRGSLPTGFLAQYVTDLSRTGYARSSQSYVTNLRKLP